jgi:hypothetical protein
VSLFSEAFGPDRSFPGVAGIEASAGGEASAAGMTAAAGRFITFEVFAAGGKRPSFLSSFKISFASGTSRPMASASWAGVGGFPPFCCCTSTSWLHVNKLTKETKRKSIA